MTPGRTENGLVIAPADIIALKSGIALASATLIGILVFEELG